jgi:hypothetical protein
VNRPVGFIARNCRNLLATSRFRRQGMAEKFDQQWRELRRHATIERDPQKLAKLIADWRNANR